MGEIIEGINNSVEIRCSEENKNRITVSIQGNENKVIIEEGVIVAESLFIFIVDDHNLVHIGKNTTFEEIAISVADNDNYVIIGEDCMFARNIKILASDFHSIIQLKTGKRRNISKGITIQNHVWVGYNVTILKNTYVYANSIIATGTILKGTVGANRIYRGEECKFDECVEEITWERLRQVEREPLISYEVKIEEINSVEYMDNLNFYIENDIIACINKIKGWIDIEDPKFKLPELYFYVEILKADINKGILIPLNIVELEHNTEQPEAITVRYGFESYMPAQVIHNQKYIDRAGLLLKRGNVSRRKEIYI